MSIWWTVYMVLKLGSGICCIGMCLDNAGICYIHISSDGIWTWGQLWGSNNFILNCGDLFFLSWELNTGSYHHCNCYQKYNSENSSQWPTTPPMTPPMLLDELVVIDGGVVAERGGVVEEVAWSVVGVSVLVSVMHVWGVGVYVYVSGCMVGKGGGMLLLAWV